MLMIFGKIFPFFAASWAKPLTIWLTQRTVFHQRHDAVTHDSFNIDGVARRNRREIFCFLIFFTAQTLRSLRLEEKFIDIDRMVTRKFIKTTHAFSVDINIGMRTNQNSVINRSNSHVDR